jgi:YidC/Oxa1 family membrane protein insertase
MGASILSSNDKYYTSTIYNFDDRINVYMSKDSEDRPLPFIKGNQNIILNGYMGGKEYDKLHEIDPRLTDTIEYGFFTFMAKPVFLFLKYIHSILGNWGWSIVAVTLIIRLVLYPLTYKGMVSMNRLKELSPKIKEIQKQYKGEPQKMNAKMMELYKKHKANPMGGCLPMLLQIPVFFAIYRVLLNSIELKHAEWIGWYTDLSVMDPYYVLPILMGASMYWQQRITPTNFTDPMQEKIMRFLPLIFTFFFMTFPAGLTLYWFVNNLFSVAQQYYVNSIFDKERAKKEEANDVKS